MSELALTVMRLGFLLLLWLLVLAVVLVLRRDLKAPRDARPLVPVTARAPGRTTHPGTAGKAAKPRRPKRRGPGSLVVVEGALTGTVIPLGTAPVTLGRAPDSTLVLDDDYASNNHARLSLIEGRWLVQDLGSTNGTWVGRTRLTGPTELLLGQQVRVGRTTLELRK
ncbi:MAG: FHA domain-containing protein [Mycobacteriaceae bacterium]